MPLPPVPTPSRISSPVPNWVEATRQANAKGKNGHGCQHSFHRGAPSGYRTRATPEARGTPWVVLRAVNPFLRVTLGEAPGYVGAWEPRGTKGLPWRPSLRRTLGRIRRPRPRAPVHEPAAATPQPGPSPMVGPPRSAVRVDSRARVCRHSREKGTSSTTAGSLRSATSSTTRAVPSGSSSATREG
jgi:hypothetical protein